MQLSFINEDIGQKPAYLYHYTTALPRIARKGFVRGPVSLTDTLSSNFARSLMRQGIVGWAALEVSTIELEVAPFRYDKYDAGEAYKNVINNWVDEREWVCRNNVPLSFVTTCYVNPTTVEYVCNDLPKGAFKRLFGSEVDRPARIWYKVEHADSPRPSADESLAFVLKYYNMISGLETAVMPP